MQWTKFFYVLLFFCDLVGVYCQKNMNWCVLLMHYLGGLLSYLVDGVSFGDLSCYCEDSLCVRQQNIPVNVPYVILGTGLLWFGWFGFNAGSALSTRLRNRGVAHGNNLGRVANCVRGDFHQVFYKKILNCTILLRDFLWESSRDITWKPSQAQTVGFSRHINASATPNFSVCQQPVRPQHELS